MITTIIYTIARGLVALAVIASAIVTMYAATNAIAVYSNYDVFLSGMIAIFLAGAVNPLFCFVGFYGMSNYLDLPVWKSVVFVLPVLLAWSFTFVRLVYGSASRK